MLDQMVFSVGFMPIDTAVKHGTIDPFVCGPGSHGLLS
jgi:hypothetical protein